MLDHWLGHEYYSRPHTPVHLPENIFTEISTQDHAEIEHHHSGHSEHEENVLCLLDINALFFVVLDVNIVLIMKTVPLIFDLFPYLVKGSNVYLSSLDPPPRIDS